MGDEKGLDKARKSPKGWNVKELAALLESYGFNREGSGRDPKWVHRTYRDLRVFLSKRSQDLKPGYVRRTVSVVDEVVKRDKASEENGSEAENSD